MPLFLLRSQLRLLLLLDLLLFGDKSFRKFYRVFIFIVTVAQN